MADWLKITLELEDGTPNRERHMRYQYFLYTLLYTLLYTQLLADRARKCIEAEQEDDSQCAV